MISNFKFMRGGQKALPFKIGMLVLIGILLFFAGAQSHRKQGWPFGQGYYDRVRTQFDFDGSYSKRKQDAQRAEQAILNAEQELQRQQQVKVEADRLNHIENSALHRMRQILIEKVPEGQLHIISETPKKIEFLLLTLQTPTLYKGVLDIDTMQASLTALGALDKYGVRGTDVVLDRKSGEVIASFVKIDERRCASLDVVAVKLNSPADHLVDRNLFHSPCILPKYIVLETGGRMTFDAQHNLYLTVGDFGLGHLVDQPDLPYGKILVSRNGADSFRPFSLGHRNPQGLFFDVENRNLVATEHGPQGGDEINIIRKNRHYGWPHVTYGVDYGLNVESQQLMANKGDVRYGWHGLYEKPVLAFIPSVGVAEINKMPASEWEFPAWSGNWFIAGMTTGNLYRMEMTEGRVVLSERIRSGRIRSFEIMPSGRILASRPDGLLLIKRDAEDPMM